MMIGFDNVLLLAPLFALHRESGCVIDESINIIIIIYQSSSIIAINLISCAFYLNRQHRQLQHFHINKTNHRVIFYLSTSHIINISENIISHRVTNNSNKQKREYLILVCLSKRLHFIRSTFEIG